MIDELAILMGDDADEQQALLDRILLLSSGEGGLNLELSASASGVGGWEKLVEFAFGRRYGWSEGAGGILLSCRQQGNPLLETHPAKCCSGQRFGERRGWSAEPCGQRRSISVVGGLL